MYVDVWMWVCVCHSAQVKVRQLVGIGAQVRPGGKHLC